MLTLVGGTFGVSGVRAWASESLSDSLHFLVLSFLCLCPGLFHLGIFVCVWLKVPDFSYDMLK